MIISCDRSVYILHFSRLSNDLYSSRSPQHPHNSRQICLLLKIFAYNIFLDLLPSTNKMSSPSDKKPLPAASSEDNVEKWLSNQDHDHKGASKTEGSRSSSSSSPSSAPTLSACGIQISNAASFLSLLPAPSTVSSSNARSKNFYSDIGPVPPQTPEEAIETQQQAGEMAR
jgi:hypothetical protein